ncbi:MAG: transketolase C-terminal domain-containing protein, partial [Candidatus Limivivens sp.]|nr:transketolase C-terminal domain-containing protein [Candidatus Limivivens sp.]
IPNMCLMAPKNEWELSDMMKFAVSYEGPIALRYPRGEAYDGLEQFRAPIVYGKSELLYDETDIAILAVGSMVKTAETVRHELRIRGFNCTLVNVRFVKPIDEELLLQIQKEHSLVVTMEENVRSGGFGDHVLEYYNDIGSPVKVLNIALPDDYIEHGSVDVLRRETGIDAESVIKKIITGFTGLEKR